ncbi:hypothetical protein BV22DRAFT_1065321 [Leucogyrophana mollusca]|uniref:Uncharacterized protein n=1 Tax=Leucogyrophana mollusca TaxID=85980 RepID=A0ACB8BJ09_9AGAM|nr:hypothetical protein BV22DRAFT_1065321 [Leucogyrophana mollusca]
MDRRVRYPDTPINRLPVELLSYIFTLTTHGFPGSHQDSSDRHDLLFDPESVIVPSVISAVSRHWRNIALSTPAIWTSLCMTLANVIGFKSPSGAESSYLDAQRLAAHLIRSRNSPLDILIDARDPDWDFTESPDDFPPGAEGRIYCHPFRPRFIVQILDFLFPHINRWRSLTILTDTWASMHAAVIRLSAAAPANSGARQGALLLENLTLMRCNEFIGHSGSFTPRALKVPVKTPFAALMDASAYGTPSIPFNPLPRLRHLSLIGVHVDWAGFPRILSTTSKVVPVHTPPCGLQTLELAYHCCEVRPSVDEFCRILERCSELRRLVLKVSGPQLLAEDDRSEKPVSLPLLEEISLSYTDAQEAARTLSLIHAPSLKTLSIEDATHPANPSEEDGGCLLTYCGTGLLLEDFPTESAGLSYSRSDGGGAFIALATSSPRPAKPPFPLLEDLSMKNVKTCLAPYAAVLGASPRLRRLSLHDTPAHALASLLPQPSRDPSHADMTHMVAPCPNLDILEVWGADSESYHVVGFAMNERARCGTPRILDVTLHLAHDVVVGNLARMYDGINVAIEKVCDEFGSESDWDIEAEDPYQPGGVFNDVEFDEFYG